jgi:hypothetical protein
MQTFARYTNPLGGALALLAVYSSAMAGEVTADLRQEVISTCAPDAYRLCPQSLTSVSDAAACMRRKRAERSATCRLVFDKAARVLAQK